MASEYVGPRRGPAFYVDEEAEELRCPEDAARDEKAYAILMRGVAAWNKAIDADKYPFDDDEYSPCFDGRSFENVSFDGIVGFYASMRRTTIVSCTMESAEMDSVQFQGSTIRKTIATDADFTSAHFDNCLIEGCVFDGCNMEDLYLTDAEVRDVDMRHCNLDEASFANSLLEDFNIEFSRCRYAIFDDANMIAVSLAGAVLQDCSFERAALPARRMYMGETSLKLSDDYSGDEGQTIEGADFANSMFVDAFLNDLDFANSDVTNAGFRWCNLQGADLRRCKGVSAGAFEGSDLAGAKLPDSVLFAGSVERIERITSLARPAYVANLLTCGALIAVFLFAERASSVTLPFFQVPVPAHKFALFGLIQSTIIGTYVSLYILRVWEALARLPTVLPDGGTSPEAISPWSLYSPAWLHLRVIPGHRRLKPQWDSICNIVLPFSRIGRSPL
ncbi:MAG TPA: pentapeptide repeat-containing protein [Sphingomicrobium sp.]|nr:pentapeptide repeat-containing protein [Sphingomicrobium sp.]